jgi:hypothetical protein
MRLSTAKMICYLLAFSATLQPVLVYGQAPARGAQLPPLTDCKTLAGSDVVVIKLATNERRLIFDGPAETPQIYRLLTRRDFNRHHENGIAILTTVSNERSVSMNTEYQEYKGHRIELRGRAADELRTREAEREEELELLIDGEPVPYGRLPDGQYALHEYAYHWSDDLMNLARRFIDYRDRANEIRREGEPREEN